LAKNYFLIIFKNMDVRRMFPRFGIPLLIASQVFLVQSAAQSSACPGDPPSQPKSAMRVIVDAVEFHGENHLSEAERDALAEEIRKGDFVASTVTQDDWATEVAEVGIRGALQNKGYLKVFAQSTPHLVHAEEHELHYVLRVDVESGTQYRLGNVRFKNNQDGPLIFGEELLRQQLKLSRGDLFDVSKVRGALENLTRLYSAKGYIDMVPAPETDINEGDSRIDLTIMIDEGSPYRIGSIEVFSSERSSFSLSQLPQSKGEVFNHGLWSKFMEDGTLKSITRNTSSHTLEITLDSRPCHRATIPGSSQTSLANREGWH
jgi:outer membrane translocation and assembly module TamA